MKSIIISLLLATTACKYTPPSVPDYQEEENSHDALIKSAVAKGDLVVTEEYYLPNLEQGRWFKVQDQFGCWWWIDSGHKFDHKQLDVDKTGKANCPSDAVAPAKETVYRNRKGDIVDIYSYGR